MTYRDKRLGKNYHNDDNIEPYMRKHFPTKYSEAELKHRKIINKKKIKLDVKRRYDPDTDKY